MRYFDHNATYPLCAAARSAWLDAVERFPANPSSPHRWGARAGTAIEDARAKVARWLGCRPSDVVWTSGATESNNTALRHLADATTGAVLVSGLEHPSVQAPVRRWLAARREEIPVLRSGVADAAWVEARLSRGGVGAVVLMAANNETGVIQPWRDVADMCARHGVPLMCDAAQWVGRMPTEGLGACEWVTGCGHKFGGPQGVGFLKGPGGFRGFFLGGPQEEGRRAGTENVAGVLSMVAAWEVRQEALGKAGRVLSAAVEERMAVRDRFVAALGAALPGIEFPGGEAPRLWNTVAALMPPAEDCRRRWVVRLDRLGFAVSTGSACSSGKEKPSGVLAAMGYPGSASDRMLRFSAGWETSDAEWRALLDAVLAAARELAPGNSQV